MNRITLTIAPDGTLSGPAFVTPRTYQGFKSATVHATPYGHLIVKLSTREGARFWVIEVESQTGPTGGPRPSSGGWSPTSPSPAPSRPCSHQGARTGPPPPKPGERP